MAFCMVFPPNQLLSGCVESIELNKLLELPIKKKSWRNIIKDFTSSMTLKSLFEDVTKGKKLQV